MNQNLVVFYLSVCEYSWFCCRDCEEELEKLATVKDDLAQTSTERDGLKKDLSKLSEEHKVLEGLRDHLESELRKIQVNIHTATFTPLINIRFV